MKHIVGRIVVYTILYCSVIFGIFVLQFTKGQTFSLTLGVTCLVLLITFDTVATETPAILATSFLVDVTLSPPPLGYIFYDYPRNLFTI